MLRETLRRIGGIEAGEITPVASPETAYRIRVRLHRSTDGRLGFMERHSEWVIPIDRCRVCVEPVNQVIEAGISATAAGLKGSSATLTLLSTDGGVVSSHSPSPVGPVITVVDRPIRCSAEAFFQSNLSPLPQPVSQVTGGLAGSRVLDLYCGIGLFGSFLADDFEQVISVDPDLPGRCPGPRIRPQ